MKTIGFCLAFLLLALVAPTSRADDYFQYSLSNITLVGNSVCAPNGSGTGTSPCVETFSESFELDYNPTGGGYGLPSAVIVPGTESMTSSGPLTLLTGAGWLNYMGGYWPIANFDGAELDLFNFWPPTLGSGDAFIEMYSCTSLTCSTDFCLPNVCSQVGTEAYPVCYNCGNGASGTITVTATPDPPTILLLLVGMAGILCLGIRGRILYLAQGHIGIASRAQPLIASAGEVNT